MFKRQNPYSERLKLARKFTEPASQLPRGTRFKPFKKIVLRILRVYSAYQSIFNNLVINLLSDLIADIQKRDSALRSKLETLDRISYNIKSQKKYKSLYFPTYEDDFYEFQQEKFRGPFGLIKDRQRAFSKDIKSIIQLSKKYPFIEAGFGRGEFLEILREYGVKKIIGIELHPARVTEALSKGFEAHQASIMDYLQNYRGKICGLSAFQVVEHLGFEEIFDLLMLTYTKMVSNGLVIIETPNPENLQVGSHSFYIDHTHKTKLPPRFLSSIFEYIGFRKIEIRYSSPLRSKFRNEVEKMIWGDFDYSIVARK